MEQQISPPTYNQLLEYIPVSLPGSELRYKTGEDAGVYFYIPFPLISHLASNVKQLEDRFGASLIVTREGDKHAIEVHIPNTEDLVPPPKLVTKFLDYILEDFNLAEIIKKTVESHEDPLVSVDGDLDGLHIDIQIHKEVGVKLHLLLECGDGECYLYFLGRTIEDEFNHQQANLIDEALVEVIYRDRDKILRAMEFQFIHFLHIGGLFPHPISDFPRHNRINSMACFNKGKIYYNTDFPEGMYFALEIQINDK